MKNRSTLVLLGVFFSSLLLHAGCGVKGDPMPPGTPAEIGRGEPTYRRAVEELDIKEDDLKYKRKTDPKNEP